MITLMGSYLVEDVERWVNNYAKSLDLRRAAGQTNVRIYKVLSEDAIPKVVVLGDWPDLATFRAFKADPSKFEAIMADAGVISQPEFAVMECVAETA